MAGISDKAIKTNYAENKYRYNGGNELQNKEFSDGSGLEMYDASFRGYDPQIGRFWQIDPLADISEDQSPYSFADNNPILLNDPLGLIATDSAHATELAPAYVTAAKKSAPKGPDVAAAAGPAPTHVAAPIQSEEEKQNRASFVKVLGYDPDGAQYQQEHMVVKEPSFWDGLTDEGDGGKLLGYNWKGNGVRQFYYGGSPNPLFLPGEGTAVAASKLPVLGEKLAYLFGKATGRLHNLERTADLARQLARIGVYDNAAGRALLRAHLGEVLNSVKGVLQADGAFTRESLLVGPNGFLKVESTWEGVRLTTVKLIGGP